MAVQYCFWEGSEAKIAKASSLVEADSNPRNSYDENLLHPLDSYQQSLTLVGLSFF